LTRINQEVPVKPQTLPASPELLQAAAAGADAVLKGRESDDAIRVHRLSVGGHRQRRGDGYMLRLRVPGGRLSTAQWRLAADVAAGCASRVHLTLRQDLQFYHLGLADLAAAAASLNQEGLSTYASGGSTVRNVTAAILGDQAPAPAFDPYPYAAALSARLSRHPLFNALPRKFKIGFGGAGPEEAQAWLNDLGFLPRLRGGERGFRLICGGGLGASPLSGLELVEWIAAEQTGPWAEAVLELFAQHAPPEQPQQNRAKRVLRALGLERVRREAAALAGAKAPDTALELPLPPAWGSLGLWVEAPAGDLSPAQMLGLGQALEEAGAHELRISFDQRLFVPGLDGPGQARLRAAAASLGLRSSPWRKDVRLVACAGPETCNRGLVNGKALAQDLDGLELPVSIHVSGCQNGCSQHLIAPLSFQGLVRVGARGRVPSYQLRVGRPLEQDGLRFGPVLATLPARQVRPALLRWIALWKADGRPQAFDAWIEARGSTGLQADVEALPPLPLGKLGCDLGSEEPFELSLGRSECH
jgi:sulfite reductase (ferredoxin)